MGHVLRGYDLQADPLGVFPDFPRKVGGPGLGTQPRHRGCHGMRLQPQSSKIFPKGSENIRGVSGVSNRPSVSFARKQRVLPFGSFNFFGFL